LPADDKSEVGPALLGRAERHFIDDLHSERKYIGFTIGTPTALVHVVALALEK
jgi:hypothetical protein